MSYVELAQGLCTLFVFGFLHLAPSEECCLCFVTKFGLT
jgi:hypothetical protein